MINPIANSLSAPLVYQSSSYLLVGGGWIGGQVKWLAQLRNVILLCQIRISFKFHGRRRATWIIILSPRTFCHVTSSSSTACTWYRFRQDIIIERCCCCCCWRDGPFKDTPHNSCLFVSGWIQSRHPQFYSLPVSAVLGWSGAWLNGCFWKTTRIIISILQHFPQLHRERDDVYRYVGWWASPQKENNEIIEESNRNMIV